MMASVAGLVVRPRPAAMTTMLRSTGPANALSACSVEAITKPALISRRPAAMTTFVPTRCIMVIDSGENTPVTTANGMVLTPACRGL